MAKDKITTSLQKATMLESIEKTLGVITQAAKLAGITRQAHYQWMQQDPEYKAAVEAITEVSLDFAESKLFELMQGAFSQTVTRDGEIVNIKDAPNTSAIIFYLKTKGKHRGYVERTEQAIDLKSINITIDGGVNI
jgi:hypothetical protein